MPLGMALQPQATHHEVFSCAGQPSWARWACPACGTWRCTWAPARPARRWNCSSYPCASSRSGCEPPCTHRAEQTWHSAPEQPPQGQGAALSELSLWKGQQALLRHVMLIIWGENSYKQQERLQHQSFWFARKHTHCWSGLCFPTLRFTANTFTTMESERRKMKSVTLPEAYLASISTAKVTHQISSFTLCKLHEICEQCKDMGK